MKQIGWEVTYINDGGYMDSLLTYSTPDSFVTWWQSMGKNFQLISSQPIFVKEEA